MERGPMALFGAIVAVGLGPAMWLGAQFGETTLTPHRPPAVTVQQNEATEPEGGSGAGDAPADQTEIVRTEPKANTQPMKTRPKPAPSASSAAPSPSESEPSTPPAEPTPPADDDPEEPSSPPTESTTQPTTPATDDDPEDPTLPPDPPSTELEAEEVADA